MINSMVESKNFRLAAGVKELKDTKVTNCVNGIDGEIDKHRTFSGHNRSASFPDIRHQETQLPVFSRMDFLSSGGENQDFQLDNRQIVCVDAGTQYSQTDFAENQNISFSNKIDVFHKLNDAILKLRDRVGQRIGEKYMDTLTKELSFVVMSRGGSTTNQGMLLYGNPGNGKTYIMEAFATALAHCVDCKIEHAKGVSFLGKNEEETTANFHKILLGEVPAHDSEGASTATSRQLRVLCIDEFEACIVETRGRLNDQVRVISNLFKSSLSGSSGDRVDDLYIIATTNAAKNIPKALLRPGRIGKKIFISRPTLTENELFIDRFCKEYMINTDSFNSVKVATLSHQKKQSVAQIKDMVVRAHQLAEIEGMEQKTNDAVKSLVSTNSEDSAKVVYAEASIKYQDDREDLAKLKFEHFYEVLHPKEGLSNSFREAMEGFSSEYSRMFFYDLDHSSQLAEALQVIRRVSNGHNKSGIVFVTGEPGSGKTAFCTELMKLSSPDIFRSTATPGQLEKIEPSLLELENEFCGRFDGFFPSNHNNRSYNIDENVHILYNIDNAQSCFSSIVLIDNGDALMNSLEPSPVRGHRNQNASFEPGNPELYLERWHQFIDNPENRNMVLVISSTKSAAELKERSKIKGMVLGEYRLPSLISDSDMKKMMDHYGLIEEDKNHVCQLMYDRGVSIKQFVDYMDKTVTDGSFDKVELTRLWNLNYSETLNSMYC